MNCDIKYIGKARNRTKKYWCSSHKYLASNKKGEKLQECPSPDKELYKNIFDIKNTQINNLKIVYENILTNTKPIIYINNEEFNGILKYDEILLSYKDLGGIMLSKLNNLSVEDVVCSHCKHHHTDNGKFVYIPHKTHLCNYCGHLFRVKNPNIGNELESLSTIPNIILNNKSLKIEEECKIEYDLLKGKFLVNSKNINNIILKNKNETLVSFINKKLENEY